MPVAGGVVNCIRVWLVDGKLRQGNSMHVQGPIVIDDIAEAHRRIVAGDKVYLYLYGDNLAQLEAMVNAQQPNP